MRTFFGLTWKNLGSYTRNFTVSCVALMGSYSKASQFFQDNKHSKQYGSCKNKYFCGERFSLKIVSRSKKSLEID